jgi:hypothetical protein
MVKLALLLHLLFQIDYFADSLVVTGYTFFQSVLLHFEFVFVDYCGFRLVNFLLPFQTFHSFVHDLDVHLAGATWHSRQNYRVFVDFTDLDALTFKFDIFHRTFQG